MKIICILCIDNYFFYIIDIFSPEIINKFEIFEKTLCLKKDRIWNDFIEILRRCIYNVGIN